MAVSKRTFYTIPDEVRSWLEERAEYFGSTLSAQITISIRERMEREVGREISQKPARSHGQAG